MSKMQSREGNSKSRTAIAGRVNLTEAQVWNAHFVKDIFYERVETYGTSP
jgi:hypothetical protein